MPLGSVDEFRKADVAELAKVRDFQNSAPNSGEFGYER